MSPAEVTAIEQLSKRFDDFREDNKTGHEDIKAFIKDVEDRLIKKIGDKDTAIKAIAAHCKDRELQVDAALARTLVATDAHIAAAKIEVLADAKPKPSVYALATKGALDGLLKFAAKAAIVVGLLAALLGLAKGLGLL